MSFITVPPMPPDHLGEVRRTSLMGGRGSRVTADGCRLLDVLTGTLPGPLSGPAFARDRMAGREVRRRSWPVRRAALASAGPAGVCRRGLSAYGPPAWRAPRQADTPSSGQALS